VGPFQLQAHILAPEKAVDPNASTVAWLALKHRAELECMGNPPDERLALIASGNCAMGRRKVAHRAVAVRAVLDAFQEQLVSFLQHE
jgi:hypothetical protein